MKSHDEVWSSIAGYTQVPFPHGWAKDEYVLFSPRDLDGVHKALMDIIGLASHRVVANHYGFDDDDVSNLMLTKAKDKNIFFLLNLDATQAAGAHESELLKNWKSYEGTMVAIGKSIHGAISHLKVTVIDGLYTISGSTNLSTSGESLQDNEMRITRDPLLAARYESIILLNHAAMLSQMKGNK